MSYFLFNRRELLLKAKDRYHNGGGKEKAAEYYISNKELLKENAKISVETCLKKRKEGKREYGRGRYRNMTEDGKNKLKGY